MLDECDYNVRITTHRSKMQRCRPLCDGSVLNKKQSKAVSTLRCSKGWYHHLILKKAQIPDSWAHGSTSHNNKARGLRAVTNIQLSSHNSCYFKNPEFAWELTFGIIGELTSAPSSTSRRMHCSCPDWQAWCSAVIPSLSRLLIFAPNSFTCASAYDFQWRSKKVDMNQWRGKKVDMNQWRGKKVDMNLKTTARHNPLSKMPLNAQEIVLTRALMHSDLPLMAAECSGVRRLSSCASGFTPYFLMRCFTTATLSPHDA